MLRPYGVIRNRHFRNSNRQENTIENCPSSLGNLRPGMRRGLVSEPVLGYFVSGDRALTGS